MIMKADKYQAHREQEQVRVLNHVIKLFPSLLALSELADAHPLWKGLFVLFIPSVQLLISSRNI
jgi:hypothetical protein